MEKKKGGNFLPSSSKEGKRGIKEASTGARRRRAHTKKKKTVVSFLNEKGKREKKGEKNRQAPLPKFSKRGGQLQAPLKTGLARGKKKKRKGGGATEGAKGKKKSQRCAIEKEKRSDRAQEGKKGGKKGTAQNGDKNQKPVP